MNSLSEIMSSQPVAIFLKEMQTRFFFITAGAFLFGLYFYENLNPSILSLHQTSAISAIFIVYVLAFSFPIYLLSLIIDVIVNMQRDSYLQHRALMRKALNNINRAEADLLFQSLNHYSTIGHTLEIKLKDAEKLFAANNLRDSGFLKGAMELGEFIGMIDLELLKFIHKHPKYLKKIRAMVRHNSEEGA